MDVWGWLPLFISFFFALLMAVRYLKTGSLRWPVFTHFLVNLLAPTIVIFLNLFIPGS
jgi:hypothetical protein